MNNKDRLQKLFDAAQFNDCRDMETIKIMYDDATFGYIIQIGKRTYFGKSLADAFAQFELEQSLNEHSHR